MCGPIYVSNVSPKSLITKGPNSLNGLMQPPVDDPKAIVHAPATQPKTIPDISLLCHLSLNVAQ